MRDSKGVCWCSGLTMAALCAPGFQLRKGILGGVARRNRQKPPPRRRQERGCRKRSPTSRLPIHRQGQSVWLRDSAQRRANTLQPARRAGRQARQRRLQALGDKFRRGVRLYPRRQGLEAAGLPEASKRGRRSNSGNALALSADGNLLAVGSSGEGSSATGINGNLNDRSMPSAEAPSMSSARAGARLVAAGLPESRQTGGPDRRATSSATRSPSAATEARSP